ncbi:MAG: class I SAM-dependent methyltransferase [Solirubrobacteraceae bacterium]|jgi:SAM-dependent methyltransferase
MPVVDDRPSANRDLERPGFARAYLRFAPRAERRGAADHRIRLLRGLRGTVLELGAGSGLNFARYPSEVTEVIAVEPEPTLRAAAVSAARQASVTVRVIAGIADELPAQDESVDAAVASLVLCSVPDQDRALLELRRVIRPGGELRFYEHVIALGQPGRMLLQLADRSGLWPKLAGGCHPARDTAAAIERGGFQITSSERIMFAAHRLEPAIPYILGVARRV